MLTKLTLTIDEKVIDRAKKYALNKNKSISRMVEEYLDSVSDNSENIKVIKITNLKNYASGKFWPKNK